MGWILEPVMTPFACPAIDEGAKSGGGAMLRKVMSNTMGIDVMVEGTINLDAVFGS
jgi:hypothetical protein